MEIIILRHGEPVMPSLKRISPKEFTNWVNSYNASGLCSTSIPTTEAKVIASKCQAIVCSELPRSTESAVALKTNEVILTSSKFNEAQLPVINWLHPKLSPKWWGLIFRIFWLFGYANKSESSKEAKIRAKESAAILREFAEKHTTVLFVGHGVYNRLIANELNSTGWLGPKSPGSKHWSFGVYKFKKHNK
jgi:broad specificity phosphatase PhoE